MLPGESISKYQRHGQSPSPSQSQSPSQSPIQGPALPTESAPAERPEQASIIASFPEDEPMFAAEVAEPLHAQHEHVRDAEGYVEVHVTVSGAAPEIGEREMDEGRDEARSAAETYSAP